VNRFLLLITPNSQATRLAGVLAVVAFLLGFMSMLGRDFDGARFYLYLSLGIMAYIVLLKYVSYCASHRIVDSAQARMHTHVETVRQAAASADAKSVQQVRRQESAKMAELGGELKSAMQHLPHDSPMRPKYEATVEMIERALARGGG
jgi:hypothetical protein